MNLRRAAETAITPANRLGLDYRSEAARLGAPPVPIIDVHSHINGEHAAAIYAEAREAYGVSLTYSMTQLNEAEAVRRVLGDSVRFIAVPNYMDEDRYRAHTQGYIDAISRWRDLGARIAKFWCAPRARDYTRDTPHPNLLTLDSEWRIRQMEHALSLGMMLMAHIADPDTWFATKYADASIYGTKAEQYEPLERLVRQYTQPWLIAHMGGWPEDLSFLTGLLERHENIYLDTSATKWMVRELSHHPRAELLAFFERFRGRILFGSDIVTSDLHLNDGDDAFGRGGQASSREQAFELYASRYWALRTLFETKYEGESPIADPDLAMVEPDRYDDMSAPRLSGKAFPADLLHVIYHDAAESLHGQLYRG